MRGVLCAFLMLWPGLLAAQSRSVLPSELSLEVVVEPTAHTPLAREMVLITIKGIYRRHITRETLEQPPLEGFNWTQLGDDLWRDERLDGAQVKTFTRRMAVFPNEAGEIEIGAFAHVLTLTDERDEWFEHRVFSEPLVITVDPAPEGRDWWFPVTSLKISDQWSNAPDQLVPGEGVLRVVRIEALGVTPEMIPPMPVLTSPSAMIFAHPDKRFVELSPRGPVSFAFWRWTIRPGNDTSAIVEPLSLDYFDTVNRVDRNVTISAQRVAYGTVVPEGPVAEAMPVVLVEAQLPGWPFLVLGGLVCVTGVVLGLRGWRMTGVQAAHRFTLLDPLARQMKRAARVGDLAGLRRTAQLILNREGASQPRRQLLRHFDEAVFGRKQSLPALREFTRKFLKAS
ncbi:hypothetical protein ROLI_042060 [Roseobacter fucihabitans]|uniref:Oxygen tolerance n=1 Tax=Roseobacter fucihabitans TaxID=1537242 RepID=A0ABZ2C0G4_9RHOB|nr:BatD family protein [Roseobacter litoralis]MBC6965085.1 hypothetical protein [Roseobacter litoralis]